MTRNDKQRAPLKKAAAPSGRPGPPGPTEADDLLQQAAEPDGTSFPIVGVGASAGGLEAFTQLLRALPADAGMAFVLVQHLAPSHASALAEILSRATRMPVMEVHGETTVEPNCVYVIPPDQDMVISGGRLQLLPRKDGGAHRPIDQFFRALAEDRRHLAIGVILSGTASDGTIGLEAIKAEGGITFAQDATAQHQGMPHSAIASGCVDCILPPEEIAREIVRIGRHPYAGPEARARERESEPKLTQVLQLLLRATGVDFTHYKFNTLYRRITRRMVLHKTEHLKDYVHFLQQHPAALEALYHDILISITSFFRNPEAFEAIKSKVFPRLIKDRPPQDPVRIWSLGCSTGQEAYSLAMAYAEFTEAAGSRVPLQLFATDLEETAVETARAGVYSKDIAQDVSAERLRRFFVEIDGTYRIQKSIRDACVFSRHNVLADPPFSRIDLISCRNLLIYLEPVLQQKIMPSLHYALKPAGFLWLGGSETIGGFRNLFEAEDAKHKIYCRKPGHHGTLFPVQQGRAPRASAPQIVVRPGGGTDVYREADRHLAKFAPPSVLVSAELEILQYRGDTGPYLAPAPGKASLNLLKMLREGLVVGVRAAILRCRKEQAPVRDEGLRVRSDGGWHELAVEVVPVTGGGLEEGGFLVLFEDASQARGLQPVTSEGAPTSEEPPAADPDTARLARELSATREYLQSVIEQQEAANEELQSANEEVQSANEELQSINEELETSKEEIQASNEELATVNDELNNRNTELNRLNNDLLNLLDSVQMAIVMLGPDMRIRRFTPAAEELLHLVPADLGRPIGAVKLAFDLPDLEPLLAEVMETLRNQERDVRSKEGRWYSLRLRPYRTLENKIDGVVLVLVDVDLLKRAEEYAQSIVATVREPLLVLDDHLRVETANVSFYRTFQVNPEETEGRVLYELGIREWDIPALRKLLEEILSQDTAFQDYEVELEFEHIGKKAMLLNARRLRQLDEHSPLILLAIEDITERIQSEALKQADRRKNEFLATLAHELRNPLGPILNSLQIMRLKGGDGKAVRSAFEMMERQVGQMVRLVDDLLDLGRISLGKIELRRRPIELAAVVSHAVEAIRPMCENMDQELTVKLPPQPVYLNADPTRVAQMVENLLSNACKFTDKGGRISISAEREGEQAVIRVRDSGVGIAAEELPHIFDMFMQVDSSPARSGSGLGIGLTLVKRMVEMHGGTVAAHSAGLGQGSELVISLPVMVETPEAQPPITVREPAPATSHRILVVDDNWDSATSLAMLLKLAGNETHTAFDGLEAVEAATTFRPDVVLLDLGLPKLSGYEVARKIREQPWGKEMVLVAVTGWGQDEDRQKSKAAGFDGHVLKPVEQAALTRLLAEITTARSAG